jgi:hypothetical protein
MSALVLATIPTHINTHERLLVWAAQALQNACNGQQVNVVANGGSAPTCQVQIARTVDNIDRFIISAYIPLNYDELNSPTEKSWMAAKEVVNAAANEVYHAN